MLAARALDQVAAETEAGVGNDVNAADARQALLTCLNKGDEFVGLLLHQDVNALVQHVVGEEYLLSSAAASVPIRDPDEAASGAEKAGQFGVTQWWMPQPVHASKGFSDLGADTDY